MSKISPTPSYSFAVVFGLCPRLFGALMLALASLPPGAAQAQSTTCALGASFLTVGPSAGTNSIVLSVSPPTGAWTATASDSWLHLTTPNQSGTGSTNVVFSFDSNLGLTRSGALSIGNQTLTVTQAGSTYFAVGSLTHLVATGLHDSQGVAVDGAGNVYIADSGNGAIKEWSVADNTVTTLVSSGLNNPEGLAVDEAGNVYIADTGNNALKEWTATNSNVVTLAAAAFYYPQGVAVDGAGNVYIADTDNDAIKKWTAANGNLTSLVSVNLNEPQGVAVDAAGNVYFTDTGNNALKEWTAANSNVVTLVSSGLNQPLGVAVDSSGNVYVADYGDRTIYQWVAASNTLITLLPLGRDEPAGVAVDGMGNIYICDQSHSEAIDELPLAFVDPTPKLESLAAGDDALPAVLPNTENLLAPFAPTSDQSWLSITGITNGVVNFSFTATTTNRTGHINLLGQTIAVVQGGPSYALASTTLLVGPTADSNSIVLAVNPSSAGWTAMANASWLHLSPASQSGVGSANVVFSFDGNPNATRSGTLTIADLTLTVIQAGSTYVACQQATTLVAQGLNQPSFVTTDTSGNVYFSDTYNSAVKEWLVADNTVITLMSELNLPSGVAVDGSGNVYVADYGDNTVKEWTSASGTVITLVSSGLNNPEGLAVDGAGNVYIADTSNNAIKEWLAANNTVYTLVGSGLSGPSGVAVDTAGNVYIADTFDYAIKEWLAATNTVSTLVASQLNRPTGVAVDAAGNVYIADYDDSAIKKWTVADNTLITLSAFDVSNAFGVAVDGTGNVYVADTGNSAIEEFPYAFVDPTPKLENAAGGGDALPVVLPVTENLLPPFAPTSDQSWLTISGITLGTVSFSCATNLGSSRSGAITLLGQTVPVAQTGPFFSLGATILVVGPSAGSNSVVLAVVPDIGIWTVTTNAPWMHLSLANQNVAGSGNIIFSYDANPGATRSGTLSVAGQNLTVTQAGSTYIASGPLTTIVSSGLGGPSGVAVDAGGNVYIANADNNTIEEWMATNNIVTTLVASGLSAPSGVAVDGAGNVYIADTAHGAVKEWMPANSNVTVLVSGLNSPTGVAVDASGNVYIANTGSNTVVEWSAANSNLTMLVSGLNGPSGLGVDVAGNVYVADTDNGAIKEWMAGNSNVTTLVSGLNKPFGVAVDGSGNVYIADTGNSAVMVWTPANSSVTTMVSSELKQPKSAAVDVSGNVYVADYGDNAIKELPRAFVDPTGQLESANAGSDTLRVVLPATENLLTPFTPTSTDPAWLTISAITNDVVQFSFPANPGSNRTAYLTLLGQTISVTQSGLTYSLGTTALLEGPSAGSNSIVLAVFPAFASWTNTANAAWLHLSPANQSGAGSTNVVFTYDANPGATRSGVLTIAGQTLTVTQAGSTYVAAGKLTRLVSSGLIEPAGVAVDGAGNVYIADSGHNAIKEWTVADNTVISLVSSGLNLPFGVRLDAADNVYVADYSGNDVKEWTAANSNLTTLVSSGLERPGAVAVDATGNVYIADSGHNSIREWMVANGNLATVVSSGLNNPDGVAVDGAGNVYIADFGHEALQEWTPFSSVLTALVPSGLRPSAVVVDGSGNVYIADGTYNAIKEWRAADASVTNLVPSDVSNPQDVAVDGTGNVYIADYGDNAIEELPYAFVDPTPKLEGMAAGADSLPVVLPATENLLAPFAPSSDQSWLTVTGITNGVVSFSFTANTGPARTANITLLGQIIPITQGVIGTPPILTGAQMLGNGVLQFSLTNVESASLTVLSTTNLALALSDWTVAGTATNTAPGQFQFTTQPMTNTTQRFYVIRLP